MKTESVGEHRKQVAIVTETRCVDCLKPISNNPYQGRRERCHACAEARRSAKRREKQRVKKND